MLCNFGMKSRLRYLTKLHFTSLNYHKVDKFYFEVIKGRLLWLTKSTIIQPPSCEEISRRNVMEPSKKNVACENRHNHWQWLPFIVERTEFVISKLLRCANHPPILPGTFYIFNNSISPRYLKWFSLLSCHTILVKRIGYKINW